MNKRIPINKLADYASNPKYFSKRKGGVKNAKAVSQGMKGHSSAGNSVSSFRVLVFLTIALAAVYFIWIN
jgi:hypothetical protein